MGNRVDSILFDIKQSIEDFGYEFKNLVEELKDLKKRMDLIEEKNN